VARLIDLTEVEILVIGDAVNCAVTVEIAESDYGEPLASIICRGCHGAWAGFQFMELGFEVQLIVQSQVFSSQNPHIIRQYLPDPIRHQILPLVSRCYSAILENFKPGFVYRTCAYADLPEAAMLKHEFLTKVVIACGYYMYREETDEDGRTYWLCGATN
jgi:hypothetical protein